MRGRPARWGTDRCGGASVNEPHQRGQEVDACPACGAPVGSFAFLARDWAHGIPGSFRLVRCDACASIYPDPRPSPETLASAYPDDYYSYATPVRHQLFARPGPLARLWYATVRGLLRRDYGYAELGGSSVLAATLGSLSPLRQRATFRLGVRLHPWRPGGALLDIGCGAAMYLDLMRALGWEHVVGVDISESAVRKAREILDIEAYAGELDRVRLPDATFDAVTISHTLEHVEAPSSFLAEVRRITRRDGRIAIVVPNASSLLARKLGEHWVHLDAPRHLVCFTPTGIRIALERAGLQVITCDTSAKTAYWSALVSITRARDERRGEYVDHGVDYDFACRARAIALAGTERALCATGAPVGEELWVVARA